MHCLNCSNKITFSSIVIRFTFFQFRFRKCGVSHQYTGFGLRLLGYMQIALAVATAFFLAFGRRQYGNHIILPTIFLCFIIFLPLDWFTFFYASKHNQYKLVKC